MLLPAAQFAHQVHGAHAAGSRARLDGSGTATFGSPAKAELAAAQIAKSETKETGTRRLIIISIQRG